MYKQELNDFFNRHLDRKKSFVCEECGRMNFSPTRVNIAHILPKQIFKSVATNDDNFLWLCLLCHARYDSSFSKAITMKCWNKSLTQYEKFKDKVTETHKFLKYFE